jgi:hypothetical protein
VVLLLVVFLLFLLLPAVGLFRADFGFFFSSPFSPSPPDAWKGGCRSRPARAGPGRMAMAMTMLLTVTSTLALTLALMSMLMLMLLLLAAAPCASSGGGAASGGGCDGPASGCVASDGGGCDGLASRPCAFSCGAAPGSCWPPQKNCHYQTKNYYWGKHFFFWPSPSSMVSCPNCGRRRHLSRFLLDVRPCASRPPLLPFAPFFAARAPAVALYQFARPLAGAPDSRVPPPPGAAVCSTSPPILPLPTHHWLERPGNVCCYCCCCRRRRPPRPHQWRGPRRPLAMLMGTMLAPRCHLCRMGWQVRRLAAVMLGMMLAPRRRSRRPPRPPWRLLCGVARVSFSSLATAFLATSDLCGVARVYFSALATPELATPDLCGVARVSSSSLPTPEPPVFLATPEPPVFL